ncbi:Tagatose-6-phosphate ketose/aldose isomerase [Citrus sinensis]|uniref:Tagatose-6-phosphate ketose/aldose isomerase n=1 Tax=Citrus sinensis TaxID=2711 RepID=A0ACB8KK92_CITSI|nr:Tagatose-6-phosphate ketose/aldose isomerase [Citrus sinensis]
MDILLSFSLFPLHPPNPKPQNPNPISLPTNIQTSTFTKRKFILKTTSLSLFSIALLQPPFAQSLALAETSPSPPLKALTGIANTKSWFQFYGDGFSIRVPPQFEDISEPEDYNAGLSLYGDKAKPKTFAARFATPDGSEVLSVVIRPSNQLKITFLEAQDITDFGTLKDAAKIFVPGGATLYSARTIKIREEEGFKSYYFYEFGRDEQHVALVAAINSGKRHLDAPMCPSLNRRLLSGWLIHSAVGISLINVSEAYIAGATAPESKWDDDGVKLRSAAISLSLL